MALTAAEEQYLRDVKKQEELEKEIETINYTANAAKATKQAEIEVIEQTRVMDVQERQTQIDALTKNK